MKRAALYVRVSTAEQRDHGLSVDNQIEALRTYCKENGYEEAGLYNDAGISARKTYKKRPALLQLVEDCNAGLIDIILITKLDRFFRSVSDYYSVMSQIGDIPWRAIWEDYETETSSGIFKVNIMLSVAQTESDRTSERIRSIIDYRRDKGDYIGGNAPIGYVVDGKKLVIDEDKRKGVRAFFESYLDYKPVKDCIDAALEYGVVLRRYNSYFMLNNITYTGNARGHICEPYITMEEFNKIQARKKDYIRKPKVDHTYIFQGLCRCGECGRKLNCSAHRKIRKSGKIYYAYNYQCSGNVDNYVDKKCTFSAITEGMLEKSVLEIIEPELNKYVIESEKVRLKSKKTDYEKKKKQLNDKLKRVAEMYEDGVISRDEYKSKKDNILSDISRIPSNNDINVIEQFPSNWREMYDKLTAENKRIFWRRSLSCIKINAGRQIELVFN